MICQNVSHEPWWACNSQHDSTTKVINTYWPQEILTIAVLSWEASSRCLIMVTFIILIMKYQVMMLTIFHNISFTLQPKVSFEINVNIIYNTGFLTYSSTTGRVARGHCSRSFGGKLITMYCTNQLYWKKNRKAFLLDNRFILFGVSFLQPCLFTECLLNVINESLL